MLKNDTTPIIKTLYIINKEGNYQLGIEYKQLKHWNNFKLCINILDFFMRGMGCLVMQKIKTLVVDDQIWVRVMLVEVLLEAGFTAFGASNYVEALEIAKSENPDIVILDINLPEIDGLNLLPLLKNIKSDLLAVFISGSFKKEYIKRAVELGAMGFFTKPFDIFELVAFLSGELASGKALEGEGKWERTGDMKQ